MNVLARLSLSWKILLLLTLGIFCSVAAAITYHMMLGRLSTQIQETLARGTEQSKRSLELSELAHQALRELQVIIREKDPDALESKLNSSNKVIEEFAKSADALGGGGQAIASKFQLWRGAAKATVDQVLLGETARANELFLGNFQDCQSGLLDAIRNYTETGNTEMNAAADELIRSADLLRMQLLFTVLGFSTVLAAVGVFTTLRISKPLRHAIHSLSAGAHQVTDAATQVSSAAQSGAQNASDQTQKIDETSESLARLVTRLEAATASAKKADEVAASAKANATVGIQTMKELDASIQAINESANQMDKIIKVIEEIAFQTNLLALNAAVEAARAGEHGKGFAVVAEEVRNLSLRSSEAARNTGTLISQSVSRAKEGATVCARVATDLDTIVGGISGVADLMVEIRNFSTEQHEQINSMKTAVGQIAEVTSRNASVAEETASTSEELTAMANTLRSSTVMELSRVVLGAK